MQGQSPQPQPGRPSLTETLGASSAAPSDDDPSDTALDTSGEVQATTKAELAAAELRKRKAQAEKLEVYNRERDGELVELSAIRVCCGVVATVFRRFGEQLQRDHGGRAHELWDDALSETEAALKRQRIAG